MEIQNKYLLILGAAAALFWTIEYWRIFKSPQIYIPKRYTAKRLGIIRSLIFLIGLSGWVLLSFSMTEPRRPLGFVKNPIDVKDIYFVVDGSGSMKAMDFQPNRLEASKRKILDFIDLHPTDRIGIVLFSDTPYTLLPLSTDLNLIRQMVDDIIMGKYGTGRGTNIGDALGLATARAAQSLAKTKIIILLTDGVSDSGSLTPIQAAEQARDQNVKIYSIGVGGKNAVYPTAGGVRRIPGGGFDFEILKKISSITKGKAYAARNEKALSNVFDEIAKLENTKIDTAGKIIYEELYLIYLLYGLGLLVLAELSRKVLIKEGL
jgi:Ca-activated chloride channel homolog